MLSCVDFPMRGSRRVHCCCGPHQRLALHMHRVHVNHPHSKNSCMFGMFRSDILQCIPSCGATVDCMPGGKRSAPLWALQVSCTSCLGCLQLSIHPSYGSWICTWSTCTPVSGYIINSNTFFLFARQAFNVRTNHGFSMI